MINRIDQWLDQTGKKLASKTCKFPTTIAASIIFMVFGIVMCLLFPSQIQISDKDIVNGRSFPYLLMVVMILSCLALLINEIRKIICKIPIETKEINLLTEIKALIIFLIFIVFYLVAEHLGFLYGALAGAIGMLLFFRCKKPSYYLITLALVAVIWAAFKYGLGVRF